MNKRSDRLRHELLKELAKLISSEEELSQVVLTGSELSKDLQNMKIFFTTLSPGMEEDLARKLQAMSKELRNKLLKSVKIRSAPNLTFLPDKDLRHMQNLWQRL
ncbi:MAG: ribosome-binding factor A [Aquificaceae bacterium]|nr:ribosome-binding factor A [Aquificaceae bacterium]MDW8237388.1 ribosome-binding factor A [Aquificaceae bacterium]